MEELSAFERFKAKIRKKSLKTQQTYIAAVRQFMQEHSITIWDDLLKGTIDEIEERIRQFLPKKSHTTANKTFWALRHFYTANKIRLNWDEDLNDYVPSKTPKINYRPRTKEEIEILLHHGKLREQVAILAMATGGVRVAGLSSMLIENGIWIDKYKLYCFLIYPRTDDEYQALFSPQASLFIKKYIGKRTTGSLFTSKFDSSYPVDEDGIAQSIRRLSKATNVYFPYEVQVDHGFRKFFRTVLETSKIHDDFAERLMGHKKEKLKKVYSHPDPLELLEASEYYKAFDKLDFKVD